jgi:hypothetical protein
MKIHKAPRNAQSMRLAELEAAKRAVLEVEAQQKIEADDVRGNAGATEEAKENQEEKGQTEEAKETTEEARSKTKASKVRAN